MRHFFGGISDEGIAVAVAARASPPLRAAPGTPIARQQFARHAADSVPGPDDRAILAHVAFLDVMAVDLSLAHKLDLDKIGREIVRIGNVLERLGKEFIGRVAESAAQGSVHPEPSAVGSDVCHSNRRRVERGPSRASLLRVIFNSTSWSARRASAEIAPSTRRQKASTLSAATTA